jgi:hypothetical protein
MRSPLTLSFGRDPSKGSSSLSSREKKRPLWTSIETNFVKSMYLQIEISGFSGALKTSCFGAAIL